MGYKLLCIIWSNNTPNKKKQLSLAFIFGLFKNILFITGIYFFNNQFDVTTRWRYRATIVAPLLHWKATEAEDNLHQEDTHHQTDRDALKHRK